MTARSARPAARALIGSPRANRSRSSASAAAFGYRRVGSFSKHLATTASSARGSPATRARRDGGSSLSTRPSTCAVPPTNGRSPARHSYRMTPSAHTSAAGPTNLASPFACSGAMYAGVPITAFVCVRSDAPRFASPKSVTLGVKANGLREPAGSSCVLSPAGSHRPFARSTLAGFRSRWTMPRSCAAATPRAIRATSAAAARGSSRPRASRSASDPPDRYSIAMNGAPACSPSSYTCTTFGCRTAAITSASAQNRAIETRSAAAAFRTVLKATSRLRVVCRARYTTPIPPRPSSASSSYPGGGCGSARGAPCAGREPGTVSVPGTSSCARVRAASSSGT